ncbi:hypothetical protein, partial [Methylobacterium marchantiae]
LFAQGDLSGALASFTAGLSIAEGLSRSDPGNAQWRRDLALSHGCVALIDAAQGRGDEALRKLALGRAITLRLIDGSPDNAVLPRDLVWFDARIAAVNR